MPKYRKKPVVVEARQTGQDYDEDCSIMGWCGGFGDGDRNFLFYIDTKEGPMGVSPGDWVVKEPFPTPDRQFYPCKPDIFAATYEWVPDEPFATPFSPASYWDDPIQRRGLGTFSED